MHYSSCNLILDVRWGGCWRESLYFVWSEFHAALHHYPLTVYLCLPGLVGPMGHCSVWGLGRCVLYLPRSTPRSYSLPLLRQGRFRTSPCQRSGSHGSAASLVLQGLQALPPHAAYVLCPDPAGRQMRKCSENEQIWSEPIFFLISFDLQPIYLFIEIYSDFIYSRES